VPDGLVRYRIAVGKTHEASPKHIVGAIANEAGLESEYIGHIKIFDDYSLVDLPEGMPKDIFQHLRKVRTCGQRLQIEIFEQTAQSKKPARPKKQSSEKARHKKRRKNKGKPR
jgi:ATP-dependent RNA helicase DeaD